MNINEYSDKTTKAIYDISYSESLKKLVELLDNITSERIFICGNGGSASNASHFCGDLLKMGKVDCECLTDNVPSLSAYTNDDGWNKIFIEPLKLKSKPGDILIVFSVHGGVGEDNAGKWSTNLNEAIDYANENGMITVSMTGFDGGYLKKNTCINVNVPIESTPIVESLHSWVCHYITFKIAKEDRL